MKRALVGFLAGVLLAGPSFAEETCSEAAPNDEQIETLWRMFRQCAERHAGDGGRLLPDGVKRAFGAVLGTEIESILSNDSGAGLYSGRPDRERMLDLSNAITNNWAAPVNARNALRAEEDRIRSQRNRPHISMEDAARLTADADAVHGIFRSLAPLMRHQQCLGVAGVRRRANDDRARRVAAAGERTRRDKIDRAVEEIADPSAKSDPLEELCPEGGCDSPVSHESH